VTDKRWLRVAEASQRSGMSVAWWRQRILRREIPFFKLGRAVLIDAADIDRMLRAGRVEPTPQKDDDGHE